MQFNCLISVPMVGSYSLPPGGLSVSTMVILVKSCRPFCTIMVRCMALALASIAKSFVTTDFFEKVVRLWDTETGQAIGPSIRLAYPVDGIVFHPDNKRLLTVDYA